MPESITEKTLQSAIQTEWIGRTSYIFQSLESTNLHAKDLISKGAPDGTIVYAETQTGGKGRWGRSWYSPEQVGLWFSIILRPVHMIAPELLTMMGCVSILSAVEELFDVILNVRWPNDLYYHYLKIAGLLTECSRQQDKWHYMILGIGINVNQKLHDFPPELRKKAISLKMIKNEPICRIDLLVKILKHFEENYESLRCGESDSVFQKWISHSDLLDREVILQVNSHHVKGIVAGFQKNGDLILKSHLGKIRVFNHGEVLEVIDDTCC